MASREIHAKRLKLTRGISSLVVWPNDFLLEGDSVLSDVRIPYRSLRRFPFCRVRKPDRIVLYVKLSAVQGGPSAAQGYCKRFEVSLRRRLYSRHRRPDYWSFTLGGVRLESLCSKHEWLTS